MKEYFICLLRYTYIQAVLYYRSDEDRRAPSGVTEFVVQYKFSWSSLVKTGFHMKRRNSSIAAAFNLILNVTKFSRSIHKSISLISDTIKKSCIAKGSRCNELVREERHAGIH